MEASTTSDVKRILSTVFSFATAGVHRYQIVLGVPGARAFFLSASLARLGVAMTGLGILWTVQGLTGSFAVAGVATGLFALAEALVGPQLAGLIDRYGQSRVVPLQLCLHVGGVAVVIWASGINYLPTIAAGAVVAGAAIPQPGALAATRWTALITQPSQLRTAFSLEAVANDIAFLSGPPVVTIISGLVLPYMGILVAVAFLVVGCLTLVVQKATEPPVTRRGHQRLNRARSLLTRNFISVLGVNLGLGFFFGSAPIFVTAFSAEQGYGESAGLILGLTSAASLLNGLVYGAMKDRWHPRKVQICASFLLLAAVTLGTVSLVLPVLCFSLVLAGMAISPVVVTSSQIVVTRIGQASLTRGFTWINTASAAGIAFAAALTGVAVELGGVRTGLFVCCLLVVLAPVSALSSDSS